MAKDYYHYYVEGYDEKVLIETLKTDFQFIKPGKIDVFNMMQDKFNKNKLMRSKSGTHVVLVFDTDKNQTDILEENIRFLKKQSNVKSVICITQVKNLEDELIRSCNISQIKDLLRSRSDSEYKHDLIQCKNLKQTLVNHHFNMALFWSRDPQEPYIRFKNESQLIIIKNI